MINNLEALLSKYKKQLNSKKELESKTFLFFKQEFGLDLSSKNLKIDLKNKEIKIVNLNSSLRFFIQNKKSPNLESDFYKNLGFKIKF